MTISERPYTVDELRAMPERDLFDGPPPVGQRYRLIVPPELKQVHGGHRWIVCIHIQDAVAPLIGGKPSSRASYTYAPMEVEAAC